MSHTVGHPLPEVPRPAADAARYRTGNYFFQLKWGCVTQVLFDNERLVIDGKALLMEHWDDDCPMRYE